MLGDLGDNIPGFSLMEFHDFLAGYGSNTELSFMETTEQAARQTTEVPCDKESCNKAATQHEVVNDLQRKNCANPFRMIVTVGDLTRQQVHMTQAI